MMNDGSSCTANHTGTPKTVAGSACLATISDVDSDPAYRNTATNARPIATSELITSPLERNAPSSEYVDPDDQPASTIPYTPIEAIATIKSTDTGRSVTCNGVMISVNGTRTSPAIGMTAKAVIAGMATTNGASMNTTLSAAVGVKSSLNLSFMPSARDCSSPNGPFMLGPWRCCMKATMRRSYQIVNRVSSIKITNANSALRATTHHRSLKNTSRSIGASGFIRVPPCRRLRRPAHRPAQSSQDHRRSRQGAVEPP